MDYWRKFLSVFWKLLRLGLRCHIGASSATSAAGSVPSRSFILKSNVKSQNIWMTPVPSGLNVIWRPLRKRKTNQSSSILNGSLWGGGLRCHIGSIKCLISSIKCLISSRFLFLHGHWFWIKCQTSNYLNNICFIQIALKVSPLIVRIIVRESFIFNMPCFFDE